MVNPLCGRHVQIRTSRVLLYLLLASISAAIAFATEGEKPTQCAGAAQQIVNLIDDKKSGELAGWFMENVSEPPGYFRTWLRVVLREYGHMSETVLDSQIRLEDFTELGMKSKGLEKPIETFKFRTRFHHEGDGIVYLRLAKAEGKCKIDYLVLGLPRSRPGVLQRYYEIQVRIDDELAALFR